MTSVRSILVGLVTLAVLSAAGYIWVEGQNQARIDDYANLVTATHGRAILYFNDIRSRRAILNQAIATKGAVEPGVLAQEIGAHKAAAEKTREEMETLQRVIAPREAQDLQKDALLYLATRVDYAETVVKLLGVYQGGAQGQPAPPTEVANLVKKLSEQSAAIDGLAKAIAEKKDLLLMN